MEYYDTITDEYLKLIKTSSMRVVKVKLELLNVWEKTIGEIVNDLSSTEGSININSEQGCRRTCSISVIDKDRKYIPTSDSPFWYNRKFKIYIGLKAPSGNLYWFSQGVFYNQEATANGRQININGVDKFGLLNGELKTCMLNVEFSAKVDYLKKNVKIIDLIREILMMNIGNGIPIDPVEPLIDPKFYNLVLKNDIVVEEGSYVGEIFTKIAEMYSVNIYYDIHGKLRMEEIFNADRPLWYEHLAPIYDFGEVDISEDELNVGYAFEGVNIVTVTTDNPDGKIYSATAKNTNPLSPINVESVGYRRYEGSTYTIPLISQSEVNSLNTSQTQICLAQAQYLLLQSCCDNLSISFDYPIIPHLDVDNNVRLSNKYFGFDGDLFLLKSITINLGLQPMSLSLMNIQWLPYDNFSEI